MDLFKISLVFSLLSASLITLAMLEIRKLYLEIDELTKQVDLVSVKVRAIDQNLQNEK